jgi:hypothetical protein
MTSFERRRGGGDVRRLLGALSIDDSDGGGGPVIKEVSLTPQQLRRGVALLEREASARGIGDAWAAAKRAAVEHFKGREGPSERDLNAMMLHYVLLYVTRSGSVGCEQRQGPA